MNKTKSAAVILGIDPGTAATGWGVIKDTSQKTELVAFGCIETSKEKPTVRRLEEIAADLSQIIKRYRPDEVAIEELFFFKNLKTAIKVAQARGVLLVTAARHRAKIYEYTPLQVKQALTGYGRADKNQVQIMVKNILRMKKIPRPDDAADALAVALCHQQSRKILKLTE
jgi:crossover junction endodeoxyribonuclease RuvC